jgi:hypothetical protein
MEYHLAQKIAAVDADRSGTVSSGSGGDVRSTVEQVGFNQSTVYQQHLAIQQHQMLQGLCGLRFRSNCCWQPFIFLLLSIPFQTHSHIGPHT